MAREIDAKLITTKIAKTITEICTDLSKDIKDSICLAEKKEKNTQAKNILSQIIKNYQLGKDSSTPICQDTGIMVVFVLIGEQVKIKNDDLENAITKGVEQGYHRLRKSVVKEPLFKRENTNSNLPAIIHYEIVPGDQLEIFLLPKGGGAENASAMKMLPPAAGINGVKQFIIDTVKNNAVNACPPIIVGVGIGGNFETAPYLAKKALLRDLSDINTNKDYAELEKELFKQINELDIGPAGLGGDTTALAVKIEPFPCHIASLPVAVNIQCHSARHQKISF